jgi:hypothetical protein
MKFNWPQFILLLITWALGVTILIALLNSCSVEHHLAKARKHTDIAIRKGAVIKPDTVWQYHYTKEVVYDTVTNTYREILKKDSSFQTINNTIAPGMSRQERIALESYYKHLEKMMKLQNDSLAKQLRALIKTNRQDNRTDRVITRVENRQPWAWVVLAGFIFAILILLRSILKHYGL